MTGLHTYTATRYVQALREGGSLPAIVDTDGGLFVVKFRGAGQGARALVSELIVGLLAQRLTLPVPELALIDIPPPFGRAEPDPEIQDILRGSHGVNVGLRYLDGAFNFDALAAGDLVDVELAARIVWLDAFVTNPDRTARNPNMLVWQRQLWLIDHGAALYAHHDWVNVDEARARTAFPLIRDHILLLRSGDLASADAELAGQVMVAMEDVLGAIPDALLLDPIARGAFTTGDDVRARYRWYLTTRLEQPRGWLTEALRARAQRRLQPPQHLRARR